MPTVDVVVECPIHDSFRVQQVAGMFDVPLAEKLCEKFQVQLPTREDEWQIGLIVGPSGSGKSTIARHAFKDGLYCGSDWPHDRAVVDAFGVHSVRHIIDLFTAVGFGSPPSWIKPYHVLSNGERFRCDLARALSVVFEPEEVPPKVTPWGSTTEREHIKGGRDEPAVRRVAANGDRSQLVVFDEFTSVVDRNVAQVGSAALARAIRRGNIPCRFVAITCHYDVAAWLAPDWILDMATTRLERRCLRRPPLTLQIYRCRVEAWQLFKRHHYLSGSLASSARCYLITWDDVPVSFCATLPVMGRKNHRRFSRIVTLPDYQGIGIGMRSVEAVAALHRREGLRINVTSSHPSLIRHGQNSRNWKAISVKRLGSSRSKSGKFAGYRSSAGRSVVSFEYIGKVTQ